MLKVRIIPTLLYKNVGLVKGKKFDGMRRISTVIPAIKVYNMREVDELILLDITVTNENREPDFDAISSFTEESFVPFTVGGGIKTIEDIRKLLLAGADKVSINSYALKNPDFINEASKVFGNQCIVISIDSKKDENGEYYCYSNSGTVKTDRKVSDWAKEVEKRGAGEILVTSIENDGMMNGYDLELIKIVTDSVKIPVIASGGASEYSDFYDAINECGVSAVAAASIYHFTERTPNEAKKYLSEKGILVRNALITAE